MIKKTNKQNIVTTNIVNVIECPLERETEEEKIFQWKREIFKEVVEDQRRRRRGKKIEIRKGEKNDTCKKYAKIEQFCVFQKRDQRNRKDKRKNATENMKKKNEKRTKNMQKYFKYFTILRKNLDFQVCKKERN